MTTDSINFSSVNIANIHESKTNPRRHFEKVDELAASVKQHGILTPLIVRVTSDSGYELIAGARRYRAAKIAKLQMIPVRVLELTDEQALEFQVLENLQREDVHPIDEAAGFAKLLEAGKYDVAALAGKVNKSESYIRQSLILNKLIPSAVKACFAEKISAGHAKLIARLQPDDQVKVLQHAVRESRSVRDLADHIHDNFHLELKKQAAWDLADETLVPAAGSCVKCPKRTGANPGLFPDVTAKDICTDGGCFQTKLVAIIKRNNELGILSINSQYRYGAQKKIEGTIEPGDYNEASGKKCGDTKKAIIVKAEDYGHLKVGQEVMVCTAKKCKTHGQIYANSSSGQSEYKAQASAKDRKRRVELKRRGMVFQKLAENIDKIDITAKRERAILDWAISTLSHDSAKALVGAMGWPVRLERGYGDFTGCIKRKLADLAPAKVPHWTYLIMIVHNELWWYSGYSQNCKHLDAAAKEAKVPLALLANYAKMNKRELEKALGTATPTKSKPKARKAA